MKFEQNTRQQFWWNALKIVYDFSFTCRFRHHFCCCCYCCWNRKCQRLIMLIKLPSHFPFLLLCKQGTKRSIIYGLNHTHSCVLFVDDSKDGTQIKYISLHRKIIMIVFLWFGFVYATYWKWCTRESQQLRMPYSKHIFIFFHRLFYPSPSRTHPCNEIH